MLPSIGLRDPNRFHLLDALVIIESTCKASPFYSHSAFFKNLCYLVRWRILGSGVPDGFEEIGLTHSTHPRHRCADTEHRDDATSAYPRHTSLLLIKTLELRSSK